MFITPEFVKVLQFTSNGRNLTKIIIGYPCAKCDSKFQSAWQGLTHGIEAPRFKLLGKCPCCGAELNYQTTMRSIDRWKTLEKAIEICSKKDLRDIIYEEQHKGVKKADKKPKHRKDMLFIPVSQRAIIFNFK